MTAIVVFGRQPTAGEVKTRLAADIGPIRAARAYEALLGHSLNCAIATGDRITLSLAAEPTGCWVPPVAVEIEVQSPGNLGDRMEEAFARAFARGADRVMIVGSDCPELTNEGLARATEQLADAPLVIGPAMDGGYWLVGQSRPCHGLFRDIPWSTDRALEVTLERAVDLGLDVATGERLCDLDTAADLATVTARGRTPAVLLDELTRWISPPVEGP
jgi:hypothetical protein